MIDERNFLHPASREAFTLLAEIATAPSRIEALRLEYSTHSLLWKLEAHGRLSRLDTDNLGIVFRVALEKRLFELASLQETIAQFHKNTFVQKSP